MNPFALDLRALALVRIAIGCLILADLAIRFPDINAFYVADGVCPVESMPHSHWTMKHLELYRQVGSWAGVAGLMFLASVAATSLVLGFHSRKAAAVSWYLLASLQNREIYLTDGGDLLLRVILFCCIFLPLGARWSLDSWRNPGWRQLPNEFFSLASALYVTQVCVIYLVAATLKSHSSWRETGDALFLALSIDQHSTAFAQWLLQFPSWLRVLNFGALATEFGAPLLILCPMFQPWLRMLGLAGLVCFHLGIASCLQLGLFVPVCLAVLLGLLPARLLDRLAPSSVSPAADTITGPVPSGYFLGWPSKVWLSSCILFVVLQNAVTVPSLGMVTRDGQHEQVLRGAAREFLLGYGRATGLMQNWTLFAPRPFLDDGWFVVEGRRADGTTVNLLTGQTPASYDKPALVSATFRNQRWRRHFQNLSTRYNPQHAPLYLRWVARKWNQTHGPAERIVSAHLIFVLETTQLPGIPLQARPMTLGSFPSEWLPGHL